MNRFFAILFGAFTLGGILELTSIYKNPDYENLRGRLLTVGLIMTAIFFALNRYFWKKHKKKSKSKLLP